MLVCCHSRWIQSSQSNLLIRNMATATSPNTSDSDSGSEGDIDGSIDILGYQFEPERADNGESEAEFAAQQTESESDGGDDAPGREGNTDWCLCTLCASTTISRLKEHKCCLEFFGIARNIKKTGICCITQHPSFGVLCLHPDVLRNVLVCLNNIRCDNWQIRPTDNKALRWAAYRQFTWWIHGHLGRRVRRVLPACVVDQIRKTFPKNEDEEYEPYASDSEDND